jgi:outer membrane protein OmpA-like peptidoglycan-associated protein
MKELPMRSFLITLAIVVLAILGLKGCPQMKPAEKAETEATDGAKAEGDAKADMKEEAKEEKAEAKEEAAEDAVKSMLASVKEGGTEYKLLSFLSDDDAEIDEKKGNWFDFDGVNFKTGSAVPTKDSNAQLENVAKIAKLFPKATFKIGGYTDNTGDEKANVKLSQARADAILAKLKKLGVDAKQLTGAEGYGSQFAVADNATEEGRAKNRRMSIRVKSK